MGYWDEEFDGNPYPYEDYLTFCGYVLPFKYILFMIGVQLLIKVVVSANISGSRKYSILQ